MIVRGLQLKERKMTRLTKKLSLFLLGLLAFVALFSTFLFFKTIFSNLVPEFMTAEAIPLAIFSGLTWVALSIAVSRLSFDFLSKNRKW